jgi:hypothetical protein
VSPIQLTSDPEIQRIALSRPVVIGRETRVLARVIQRDALNDQTPVAQDDAAVHVVLQGNALKDHIQMLRT